MKNRIAFYGASVTRQVNGYWEYFARLNPDFEVSPFGNGAMHLNDAGICYIDDVIDPGDTRKKIANALDVFIKKHSENPPKKHGNIPL